MARVRSVLSLCPSKSPTCSLSFYLYSFHPSSVGKLTVLTLLAPSETVKNRALRVNSFTTTPLDILAEYEKQTGGQKWDIEYTSLEDVKKGEKKAYEDGDATATTYTLRRIWAEGRTLYEKRDNGLLGEEGEKTERLELVVTKAVEAQKEA